MSEEKEYTLRVILCNCSILVKIKQMKLLKEHMKKKVLFVLLK